jgi:hypothetical protein
MSCNILPNTVFALQRIQFVLVVFGNFIAKYIVITGILILSFPGHILCHTSPPRVLLLSHQTYFYKVPTCKTKCSVYFKVKIMKGKVKVTKSVKNTKPIITSERKVTELSCLDLQIGRGKTYQIG